MRGDSMKKEKIIILLMFLLVSPACSQPVNYQYTNQVIHQYYQEDAPLNNGTIVIEDVTVNGIGLGYDFDLVKEKFGTPLKVQNFEYHQGIKEISGNKYPHEVWSYDGIKIEFVNSKVDLIDVYSNSYVLSNGIVINDPVTKLDKLKGFDQHYGGFRTESGAIFYAVTETGLIANISISIMYD